MRNHMLSFVLLCMISLFPLAVFKIFLLHTDLEWFDFVVCWYGFPHDSCAWGLLNFLDPWIYSFHQFWQVFSHYFFYSSFFSPSLFSPLRNLVTRYLLIHAFSPVLALRCCLQSFSSCGAQAVGTWASVVAARGLKSCSSQLWSSGSAAADMGLAALQHVGSSRLRD